MKKLMIAFAAALMGVAANAAALNWSAWGYINDGQGAGDYPDGYYYLYVADAADAVTVSVLDGQLTVTGGTLLDQNTASMMAGAGGPDYTHATGKFYATILLTTDGAEDALPTSGTYGFETVEVVWDTATGGDANFSEAGLAVNTQVAPEPTSGLLLLLGVAGLALRRRRA